MRALDWIKNLPRFGRQKPDNSSVWIIPTTPAGQYVDQSTAETYSAVWRCVRVISSSVAQLPWKVYRKTARGKKEEDAHPVAWLINTQPNPEITAFRFKRQMVRDALLWGNGYCEIERDTMGRPMWLWPIEPQRVRVERNESADVVYRVTSQGRPEVTIPAADMLHFRGPDDDGMVGTSVIAKAKNSIGLGLAMEQFSATFFGNGGHVSGALKHPGKLSKEAKTNLRESFVKSHSGRNAMTPMVLEEGMDYVRIAVPPEDAQFLGSRQHQVIDICRWFGVPPHKLGDLGRATWNNIESQSIDFVTDTIVPWTCNFEEEVNIKLFGRQQRGVLYTKFTLAALLRGDTKSRFDSYAVGRQWGWLSANDVRALEEMNPIANGNTYLVPANMTTAEKIKEAPAPGTAGPQPPEPEPAEPPEPVPPRNARLLNKARIP